MRSLPLPTLLLLLTTAAPTLATPPVSRATTLHLQGRPPITDAHQTTPLADLGITLLQSSNFNTTTHPDQLKQSIPDIHDAYRRTAAGDHLVITFDRPTPVITAGGPLTILQIIIGLGPDQANALFTLDPEGRLTSHSKYSGHHALQLRQSTTSLLQSPPKQTT